MSDREQLWVEALIALLIGAVVVLAYFVWQIRGDIQDLRGEPSVESVDLDSLITSIRERFGETDDRLDCIVDLLERLRDGDPLPGTSGAVFTPLCR